MRMMQLMMVEVLFSDNDGNDGGSVGLVRMMPLMMVEVLV